MWILSDLPTTEVRLSAIQSERFDIDEVFLRIKKRRKLTILCCVDSCDSHQIRVHVDTVALSASFPFVLDNHTHSDDVTCRRSIITHGSGLVVSTNSTK